MLDPFSNAVTGNEEIVARAESLRSDIGARSDEIERNRCLPPDLLDKMHDAQLFRLLLPKRFNGLETDPITFMRVIETIARADGSTAWCVSQAAGCAMAAAYLDAPVAEKLFGSDPGSVLAWGPGPKARAIAVEGGYRVSGVWAFASGARHATLLGAHCPIFTADGAPVLGPDGKQLERSMLVPSGIVPLTDIWHTIGLRGTGSDQFALNNHFVRADHSITREYDQECRESGPTYKLSALIFWEIGFASVGIGIARASLSTLVDFARNKVPRGFKSPIRDNAVVQTQLAQAEVGLRAARAHMHQCMAEIWGNVCPPDALLTVEQRIAVRMASTYAIHKARDAVDFAYNAAGTSAVFDTHPLERRFRDMHTVTQHLQGRLAHFETVGAWMMGAEADLTFV